MSRNKPESANTLKIEQLPSLKKSDSRKLIIKKTDEKQGRGGISSLSNEIMEKRIKALKQNFDIQDNEEEIIEIVEVKNRNKRTNIKQTSNKNNTNHQSRNYETPLKKVQTSRTLSKSKNTGYKIPSRLQSSSSIKNESALKNMNNDLKTSSKFKTPKVMSNSSSRSRTKLTDTLKQNFKSKFTEKFTKPDEEKNVKRDTKRRPNYWGNTKKPCNKNPNPNKENLKPSIADNFENSDEMVRQQNSQDVTVNKEVKIVPKNKETNVKKEIDPIVSVF